MRLGIVAGQCAFIREQCEPPRSPLFADGGNMFHQIAFAHDPHESTFRVDDGRTADAPRVQQFRELPHGRIGRDGDHSGRHNVACRQHGFLQIVCEGRT